MNTIGVLGWFALVVSVIYTAFGLPVQIVKNYKNKSTEGLSFWMFLLCGNFLYTGRKEV